MTCTNNYIRGLRLAEISDGTATRQYTFNAHGDVTGLVDTTTGAVTDYTYDAYGNEDNASVTDTNPFRYSGEYYDTETGFIYLRARYYDPSIGRFTAEDTHWTSKNMVFGDREYEPNEIKIPSIEAIKQSANLYVYAINNPVYYIDISGLIAYPGQIHNLVVNELAKTYDLNKEQTIQYSLGWGRADLISNDGTVWDVKRDKPNQIASGVSQVRKYTMNTWKKNPDVKLYVGGYLNPGSFMVTLNIDTYYVNYHYAENGVIAYDYDKVTNFETVKTGLINLGMFALSAIVLAVTQGAGSLQPAG